MSAFEGNADMARAKRNVRFWPLADNTMVDHDIHDVEFWYRSKSPNAHWLS
jgi:hypothetical protein